MMPAEPTHPQRRRYNRLTILLLLGVLAIAAGLAIRKSTWAQERRLRTLSLEELALAIHDAPGDALTFLYYGGKLLTSGNVEASERAFARAAQLDPKMTRAHLGLGSARMRRGDFEAARASFEEAIRLDPREPAGYLGLAQSYYRAGSPRRAIEPLKKIIALQPGKAVAWYNLGKVYGDARQSDLSLEALRKAVALDPNRAEYWRDLGRLSQHYSRLDEAEAQFKRALALSPNDPQTQYWLGQLYAQKGNTPGLRADAERALLAAIQHDPNLPEAYFELGQLYERSGDYKRAAENYDKARGLDLSDEKSLYHLGLCLIRLGKGAEGQKLIRGSRALAAAKRDLENVKNRVLAEPENRPLRLRAARLYRRYEDHDTALSQYQVYQQSGPPDPAVDREVAAYRAALEREEKRADKGAAAAQP